MTSKSSSSKSAFSESRLIRDEMRRNLWSIVLSGLLFFFTLPLPVLMMVQQFLDSKERVTPVQDPDMLKSIYETAVHEMQMMVSGSNPMVKMAIVVLAIVCGVTAFSYLHSRQKVDFYHSLPISRTRLYVNRFVTGILCTVPMYLIMLGISAAVIIGSGLGEGVIPVQLIEGVCSNLIHFLLIYALSVVTTILCGHTVITLLLLIWVQFSLTVVRWLQMGLFEVFFDTYVNGGEEITDATKLSPIMHIFTTSGLNYLSGFNDGTREAAYAAVPVVLTYLVLAVLFSVLGCFLFRIRKSERAGTALAFDPPKVPIKVYMCLVAGIAFGLLFQAATGSFWFWPGLILGTVLMHAVAEIIYAFDFRALLHKPVHLVAILVVLFAAMLGLQFDVFHYDSWLPAENQIAGALLSDNYHSSFVEEQLLVEPANIQAIRTLAEAGIQENQRRKGLSEEEEMAEDEENAKNFGNSITNSTQSVTVNYKLTNGKCKSRTYQLPVTTENVNLAQSILSSEEYKRTFWPLFYYLETCKTQENGIPYLMVSKQNLPQPVETTPADLVDQANQAGQVAGAAGVVDPDTPVPPPDTPVPPPDDTPVDVYNVTYDEPVFPTASVYQDTKAWDEQEQIEMVELRDWEKIQEIINTLCEESLHRDKPGAVPVLAIELRIQDKDDEDGYDIDWWHGESYRWGYGRTNAYVTMQDTKTLALIKQYLNIDPVRLPTDDITRIKTNNKVITDPAEIAVLLQDAFSPELLDLYDSGRGHMFGSFSGCDVIPQPYDIWLRCYAGDEEENRPNYRICYPYPDAPMDLIYSILERDEKSDEETDDAQIIG